MEFKLNTEVIFKKLVNKNSPSIYLSGKLIELIKDSNYYKIQIGNNIIIANEVINYSNKFFKKLYNVKESINTYGLKEFIELDNVTYNDKVSIVTNLFTKEQNIKWAILVAESVLHIFEDKYPNDKRPREAIEAAKRYLKHPSEENNETVEIAVRYAECSAECSAGSTAGSAAWSAGYAAWCAIVAAEYARYAADAAWCARSAAWSVVNEQEKLNLKLMLKCIK